MKKVSKLAMIVGIFLSHPIMAANLSFRPVRDPSLSASQYNWEMKVIVENAVKHASNATSNRDDMMRCIRASHTTYSPMDGVTSQIELRYLTSELNFPTVNLVLHWENANWVEKADSTRIISIDSFAGRAITDGRVPTVHLNVKRIRDEYNRLQNFDLVSEGIGGFLVSGVVRQMGYFDDGSSSFPFRAYECVSGASSN